MANLQVLGTDKALRMNDFPLLNLVSSFDWAPNFNAQDIYEMGTTTKLDTATELETSGSFGLSSVGNTAGILARMAVTRSSGNFTGWKYDPAGASGKNAYVFTQDDLADMKFDLIMHEKPDQKTYSRSVYLPCAYVTSFGGRVDANGAASETFNFAGNFVIGFKDPFHDIRSVGATRTTATTCTLLDATVTSTTHTIAYLFVDGKAITSRTSDATHVTLGAAGLVTITTSEGYTIPVGSVLQALVYQTTPSTTFPTALSTDRFQTTGNKIINFVRGHMATVYLAPVVAGSPTASEAWLRVQSMDWNVDMRTDTLRQVLANTEGTSVFSRVPTYPLDVTANVSVVESDWADWKALLASKSFTGTDVHDNTYDLTNLTQQFAVVVNYYTKSGTLMQNWRFLDLSVQGMGTRASVGGRGEVSWSFRGTSFRLEGFNP